MESTEISELYGRFGFVVYRRCLKLLRDKEQARDAAQEVFVRAVRHADKLTFDRECLPWLYRVATNYCLNVIRDDQSARHVPLTHLRDPSPADHVERRLVAREALVSLLGQLDDVASQIAVYYHWDDMTQEEIAVVMGLSRRTVGKKLKQLSREVTRLSSQGVSA